MVGWERRKGWVGMQPLVGEGAQRREERKDPGRKGEKQRENARPVASKKGKKKKKKNK